MPALSAALLATLAAAPSLDECVAASEQAQVLRQQGKLFAARHELSTCSQSGCPALLQNECTRWLDEVLTSMPTVVVVVRIGGSDQRRAAVLLDGQMWLSELTGTPQEVEPGAHRITVEISGERHEQQVVVNVNEKNRLVVFSLEAPPPPPRPTPWAAYAASAGVVAGFAVFTGFGLAGRTSLDGLLADPCAATKMCNPSRADAIRREFVAADVGLAVGIVAAGLAVWQWWSWATWAPPVMPVPIEGGGAVTLFGRW